MAMDNNTLISGVPFLFLVTFVDLTGNFLFISPATSMDLSFHSPPESTMSFLAITISCKRPRLCYSTARMHRRFEKMKCIF